MLVPSTGHQVHQLHPPSRLFNIVLFSHTSFRWYTESVANMSLSSGWFRIWRFQFVSREPIIGWDGGLTDLQLWESSLKSLTWLHHDKLSNILRTVGQFNLLILDHSRTNFILRSQWFIPYWQAWQKRAVPFEASKQLLRIISKAGASEKGLKFRNT